MRGGGQVGHLAHRRITVQHRQAAIRRRDQPRGVDVLARGAQAFGDFFSRLDARIGDIDAAQNDIGLPEAFQQRQIVMAMRIFYRNCVKR